MWIINLFNRLFRRDVRYRPVIISTGELRKLYQKRKQEIDAENAEKEDDII